MRRGGLCAAVCLWAVAFVTAQQGSIPGSSDSASPALTEEEIARLLPEASGRETVARICANECHTAETVAAHAGERNYWERIVQDMTLQGAQFTSEEQDEILGYLASQFPPKIDVNLVPARTLETQLRFSPEEAAAIVAYRTANGPFGSIEALRKVPGLAAEKIDAVKRRLVFGNR